LAKFNSIIPINYNDLYISVLVNFGYNVPKIFGSRNIFEDQVLVELSQQARDLIDGVSPGGIKKNDVMRQKIKNEMNELKLAIDAAIEDMPRRKIRMAS
jgi:hypothetical protein